MSANSSRTKGKTMDTGLILPAVRRRLLDGAYTPPAKQSLEGRRTIRPGPSAQSLTVLRVQGRGAACHRWAGDLIRSSLRGFRSLRLYHLHRPDCARTHIHAGTVQTAGI